MGRDSIVEAFDVEYKARIYVYTICEFISQFDRLTNQGKGPKNFQVQSERQIPIIQKEEDKNAKKSFKELQQNSLSGSKLKYGQYVKPDFELIDWESRDS